MRITVNSALKQPSRYHTQNANSLQVIATIVKQQIVNQIFWNNCRTRYHKWSCSNKCQRMRKIVGPTAR